MAYMSEVSGEIVAFVCNWCTYLTGPGGTTVWYRRTFVLQLPYGQCRLQLIIRRLRWARTPWWCRAATGRLLYGGRSRAAEVDPVSRAS